jgi:DNA-directed RNA polymerase specialized sigma24 family protein
MTGEIAYLRPGARVSSEASDEVLIAACALGDTTALAALFDRHHRSVYGFLARMCGAAGPDLDDLVQTTFLGVLRGADRFGGRAAVRTWILGIANVETQRQIGQLRAALPTLPHDLRVAFVMCDVEGVPGVEAARAVGVPPGTMWRRLHEARKALAAAIERRHA